MSRRIVTQEARKAWKAREGQANLARCFATTSAIGQGPRKRIIKETKKKDDKLRHAINIFQMAEWFFPTTASESAATTSSLLSPEAKQKTAKKKQAEAADSQKDEFDEILDDHIRGSILGKDSNSVDVNFDRPVNMQNAYSAELDKNQKDRSQHTSIFDSTSPNDEPSADLLQKLFPPGVPMSIPLRSAHARGTDAVSRNALHDLPPVEDREAVERHMAQTVKRANAIASQDRQRPSNLDVRGAQVMDALYGTVAGVLPGLEVLKERVREREQRERAQQQTQGQEEK